MKTARALVVVLAFVSLFSVQALAQDSNYWTEQYGTRSTLLGGAVIGTVNDLSGTFYNPGALGLIENPSFLVAASIYQVSTLTLKDETSDFISLSSSRISPAPGILAGSFRFAWAEDHRFAYSFITRQRFKVGFDGWVTGMRDVLPAPGQEFFTGQVRFDQDMEEYWAGLTWAKSLSGDLGLGVTMFGAYRSQHTQFEWLVQALGPPNDFASTFVLEDVDLSHARLLWKGGIDYHWNDFLVGATVTTPSVGVFGSGSAGTNATILNQDVDGDSIPDIVLENNLQDDVDVDWKSPLSIGVGGGWTYKKTQLHVSAEWFDGIDPFTVLETVPFVSQTGDTISPSFVHEAESVVNWAVGIQQDVGSSFHGFVSFTSDRAPVPEEGDRSVTIANWDLVHLAAGASFTVRGAEFTLGGSWAFGDQPLGTGGAQDETEEGELPSLPADATLEFSRFQLIVGFTLAL